MAKYVRNAFVYAVAICGWKGSEADVEGCEEIGVAIESNRFENGRFREEGGSLRVTHRHSATFLVLEGGGKTLRVELYPILTEKDECFEVLLSLSLMGQPISPERSLEFAQFWEEFLERLPPF
ncbi:MAG: hypothetical protein HGA33_02580 [Candidatus Moranbacteria bacterium]|nr:hypothetical protein [Candidatus Moranbacteria bacterium]